MQWNDEAVVLSAVPHGEHALIVHLFTLQHGHHAGLVRGRKSVAPICQTGNYVQATWSARLPEQLGTYALELTHPTTSLLLDEPLRLAALASACSMMASTLPEREPTPELYLRLRSFALELEHDPLWVAHYLTLELELLSRLGYGLELSVCAATGVEEGLTYVSPKSGQAVCATSGRPYHDRLLALPLFLQEIFKGNPPHSMPKLAEIVDGFRLTGYFLDKHVFTPQQRLMPAARGRLVERFQGSYA